VGEIIRLHRNGFGSRTIAERLHISRTTVQKYLREAEDEGKQAALQRQLVEKTGQLEQSIGRFKREQRQYIDDSFAAVEEMLSQFKQNILQQVESQAPIQQTKPSAPQPSPAATTEMVVQPVMVVPESTLQPGLLEAFNKLFQQQQATPRLAEGVVMAVNDTGVTPPPVATAPSIPRPAYQPPSASPTTYKPSTLPDSLNRLPPQMITPDANATSAQAYDSNSKSTLKTGMGATTFATQVIHVGDAVEDAEEKLSQEIPDGAEGADVTPLEVGMKDSGGMEPPHVEIPEGYELVDSYWVNPPHCSVAVLRRSDGQEKLYYLVEPVLDEFGQGLLAKLNEHLRDLLSKGKTLVDMDRPKMLDANTDKLLHIYGIELERETRDKLRYYLHRDFIGYGKIDGFMYDSDIEDISCDGVEIPIFLFHRRYQNIATNVNFGEEDLDVIVVKLAQKCGKHISIGSPITQATLPDGSRLEATLGREVTTRGSSFTIRRFRAEPFTPVDLVKYGTYSTDMLAYMWLIIENNMNFIIAGGTASGKTSTLNALSIFIPPSSKIVSIEDTRELTLYHQNWVAKVTRESTRGAADGEIGMFELLRSALRERPEYILVGEVRGPEAQVLFQAMNTGHTTYSTMHAGSVQAVINRLLNEPINVPIMMLQALNVVMVQAMSFEEGRKLRRCKYLVEITNVDQRTGNLSINEVFTWSPYRDAYEHKADSFVLSQIMQSKGWTTEELQAELANRAKVITYLLEKDIHRYADVAPIIEAYYRNPQWALEQLERGEL